MTRFLRLVRHCPNRQIKIWLIIYSFLSRFYFLAFRPLWCRYTHKLAHNLISKNVIKIIKIFFTIGFMSTSSCFLLSLKFVVVWWYVIFVNLPKCFFLNVQLFLYYIHINQNRHRFFALCKKRICAACNKTLKIIHF